MLTIHAHVEKCSHASAEAGAHLVTANREELTGR
jgi:hypothetical protein